jgi:hypothetical protein
MEGDEWSIDIIEKPRGMMILIIKKNCLSKVSLRGILQSTFTSLKHFFELIFILFFNTL